MGYYTSYSLTWTKGSCDFGFSGKLEDALVDSAVGDAIVAGGGEICFALSRDGETCESSKWYEHESDMKAFSLKFPAILFTLSGEGEEGPDIWKKYFRDGKMQICKAILTFPEFSARLLK